MEQTTKRSHKKLIIILVIVAALLAALSAGLFGPALACEIRTAQHLDEFAPVIKDYDKFVSDGWKFKVLEYSDESAMIYRYTMKNGYEWGETKRFIKESGEWDYQYPEWVKREWDDCQDYLSEWDDAWNFKTNQFVPQYWWHAFQMCF